MSKSKILIVGIVIILLGCNGQQKTSITGILKEPRTNKTSLPNSLVFELNQTYGGNDDDFGVSIIQMDDDGFIIAGNTVSFGAGAYDAWLVKISATGEVMWNQTYGGFAADIVWAIIQTSSGGFALAGHSNSFGANGGDFFLIKVSASGELLWNRTYGGLSTDSASSLIQTDDGGFLLAGNTKSFGAGEIDLWVVKTDPMGMMVWNQTYGGLSGDWATSFIQTPDNGFLLAGETSSFGAGESDMWVVKINATGEMVWNQTYGGSLEDHTHSLVQTSDNGFLLAGETNSFGAGESDMWVVKINETGEMVWNQTYGGPSNDRAYSLVQTSDNGFLLVGDTFSYGIGRRDGWVVKTDSIGEVQWNHTYGSPSHERLNAIIQTNDGGFALVGEGEPPGGVKYDIWLLVAPHLSTPTVLFPNDGEILTGWKPIHWTASHDLFEHSITYFVSYSVDNGTSWITIGTETTSALFSWDTTTVTDGSTYLVRVNASCSEGVWKMDISDTLFTVDNIKDNSPNFQIHWPFLFSVSSLPVIIISKKIAKRHKYSKL
ncbi:MAG: hypothetical protein ACXACP_05730 [Candidatus Hodarchaeales archaeon]